MHILDAINDRKVFGPHFRGATWDAWRAFLAALFALPMSADQLATFRECTGRSVAPTAPSHEAWLVIGRRGGKSFLLAIIAVFLACFRDWRPYLGPGEVGTIMVVCADRRQARVIMRYALGLLKAVPMLSRQIENVTRESISLRNRVAIEVHTASFRTTRGYTIVCALLDEIAYFPTDEASAEPDAEVVNAIKPAMSTIPGAMLLCASSPYSRRGVLYDAWRKHFGKDGDPILCWQAPTRTMNPSVPQSFIDEHMADDPARASAEYLAQFRSDIEGFVSREAVEACVISDRFELPPEPRGGCVAFIDPSGGSSDSMTLAIAKRGHEGRAVLCALREVRPPFSPESVVADFVLLLKSYGTRVVRGDRYAGEWPVEQFAKRGIRYEQSAAPKSDLYRDLLPLLNSGRVELLDHPKLVAQLCSLERRTSRAGKDSIDHAAGGHDDVCNAAAGALVLAAEDKSGWMRRLPEINAALRAMPPNPKFAQLGAKPFRATLAAVERAMELSARRSGPT